MNPNLKKGCLSKGSNFMLTPLWRRIKYFCFQIDSLLKLEAALGRFFDKGSHIRTAWYEKVDCETEEVRENQKLQLPQLLGESLDENQND